MSLPAAVAPPTPPGPAFVRDQLRALLAEHGPAILDDPRRFEALLRDLSGEHRREAHLLVSALRERVPTDLLAPGNGLPRSLLVARLAQRLHDNLGIAESFARWAVVSWALALGTVTDWEAAALDRDEPPSATAMPGDAETVIVDARGRGDYETLEDAVHAAPPHTRILVAPGRYTASVDLDKPLEIVGDGPARQIVLRSVDAPCLRITAPVTLRALSLARDGTDARGATVDVAGGKVTLEDCIVSGTGRAAVAVSGRDTELVARRLQVEDAAHTGLLFEAGARGVVEDCEIRASRRNGVHVSDDANPLLRRCHVHHGLEIGVLVDRGGRGVFEHCEIADNAFQGVIISAGAPVLTRCRVQRNDIGIWVERGGQGVVEGCDLRGNRVAAWRVKSGSHIQHRGNKE